MDNFRSAFKLLVSDNQAYRFYFRKLYVIVDN